MDIGADRPGAEHGCPDAIRRQIVADAFGEGDHRSLARCVDRKERRHPDEPGERCGIDHMTAFPMGPDARDECLDAVHHAAEIDADPEVPVVIRRTAQRALDADPRIVDDHVHLAEAPLRLIGCARHRGAVAHIDRDAVHALLRAATHEACERGIEVILAQVADGDAHAGIDEGLDDAEADAARASRHEGHLVAKVFHGACSEAGVTRFSGRSPGVSTRDNVPEHAEARAWPRANEDFQMPGSTDRILTTHVGSLPRPQDVVDLLFAEDREEAYDHARFETVMRRAVLDVVRKQAEVGIDAVSDGETSKISYATYIRHRLTGFEGDSARPTPKDLEDFPEYRDRLVKAGHSATYKRPVCRGPIAVRDLSGLERD